MKKKNPHFGSSFESWLDQEGIRKEVTAAARRSMPTRRPSRPHAEERPKGASRSTSLPASERRARWVGPASDLPEEWIEAVSKAKVPEKRAHLDAELKDRKP